MSKKALIRFCPGQPGKKKSDFLWPKKGQDDKVRLASIVGGGTSDFGLVVYTGRTVTAADVFAKVIDSGSNINSAGDALADLADFTDQLGAHKIGTVVQLIVDDSAPRGFLLVRTGHRPYSVDPSKLP